MCGEVCRKCESGPPDWSEAIKFMVAYCIWTRLKYVTASGHKFYTV